MRLDSRTHDDRVVIYPSRAKMWLVLLGSIAFKVPQVGLSMKVSELGRLLRTRYGVRVEGDG